MKSFLLAMILCLSVGLVPAQSFGTSVNVEAVRALIGNNQSDVRILFVGDDIRPFLDGTEKTPTAWLKLKRKTDVFIVFSEETKAVVELKVKKKQVLVGDSLGSFFNRSWRDQDFLTWIELNGDKVSFVETPGRKFAEKGKRELSDEDRKLAEYVTSVSSKKGKVEVLIVGTKVDKAYLDSTDLASEFSQLDKRLSYVIVHSEELKKMFSAITKKEVYVRETIQESLGGSGSLDRLRWSIVQAKGSELITVRGSGNLSSILTLRSERDKR